MFLEFINQSNFVIFSAVALIISLSSYSKYFDTVLKYLPIILAYTLINELLGYFLLYYPSFRVFLDFEYS
ncbi:MAG: putative membrane protein YpjA [Maribacter sp.]